MPTRCRNILEQTSGYATPPLALPLPHGSHRIKTQFLTMMASAAPARPPSAPWPVTFSWQPWAQPARLLSALQHTTDSTPELLLFLQPQRPFLLSLPRKSQSSSNAASVTQFSLLCAP